MENHDPTVTPGSKEAPCTTPFSARIVGSGVVGSVYFGVENRLLPGIANGPIFRFNWFAMSVSAAVSSSVELFVIKAYELVLERNLTCAMVPLRLPEKMISNPFAVG